MAYRWKPSKTQAAEFANKMNNDAEFAAAYQERKNKRADKRRSNSKFDYSTAGGQYIPTYEQFKAAHALIEVGSDSQKDSARTVIYGYTNNISVHHDAIHVINEYRRKQTIA